MKKRSRVSTFVIVTLALLGVGVGVCVMAALNINRVLDRLRPHLEEQATKMLNAPVSIGSLQATLFPSATIKLQNTTVGGAQGLSLADASLKVKLAPLLSGNVHIDELVLNQPAVDIRRDSNGVSIAGLSRRTSSEKPEEREGGASSSPSRKDNADAGTANGFAIKIERISVRGATVTFHDEIEKITNTVQRLNATARVSLDGGTLRVRDAELDGELPDVPLSLRIPEMQLRNGEDLRLPKLELSVGKDRITLAGQLTNGLNSGTINVSAPDVQVETLTALLKVLKPQTELPASRGNLGAELIVTVSKSPASNLRTYSIQGKSKVTGASVQLPAAPIQTIGANLKISGTSDRLDVSTDDLNFTISEQPIRGAAALRITGESLEFQKVALNAAGGEISTDGSLGFRSPKPLALKIAAKQINLHKLVAMLPKNGDGSESKLSLLEGTASIERSHLSGDLSDLTSTASGDLTLDIRDGKIAGQNFARDLLQSTKGLPFLSDSLLNAVPEELRNEINAPETVFHRISATARMRDGVISTDNLEIDAPLFNSQCEGSAQLSGELDLRCRAIFTPTFSAALAKKVKEIRALFDRDGQLVVPLTLTGQAPALRLTPDLNQLGRSVASNVIADKASSLLDKLLKGKHSHDADHPKESGLSGFLKGL